MRLASSSSLHRDHYGSHVHLRNKPLFQCICDMDINAYLTTKFDVSYWVCEISSASWSRGPRFELRFARVSTMFLLSVFFSHTYLKLYYIVQSTQWKVHNSSQNYNRHSSRSSDNYCRSEQSIVPKGALPLHRWVSLSQFNLSCHTQFYFPELSKCNNHSRTIHAEARTFFFTNDALHVNAQCRDFILVHKVLD